MSNNTLQTKPYLFDRHFEEDTASSPDGTPTVHHATQQNSKKAKRFYDEEELKKAREDARNEALAEFESSEQKRLAQACEAITAALKSSEDVLTQMKSELTKQCVTLSAVVSKKLISNTINNHSITMIESLILSILPSIFDATRIDLRVNQDIAAKLQETLEPSIKASGFSQHINVIPDQHILGSDCVIEWPGGGASRNQSETWQNIKRIIENVTEQSLDDFADTEENAVDGEPDPQSKSSV